MIEAPEMMNEWRVKQERDHRNGGKSELKLTAKLDQLLQTAACNKKAIHKKKITTRGFYFPRRIHSATLHRIEVRDADDSSKYGDHHNSTSGNAQQEVLERWRHSRTGSLCNLRNHHRCRQRSGRKSSDGFLLQRRVDDNEPWSGGDGLARPRRQWIEEGVVGEPLLAGVGQGESH